MNRSNINAFQLLSFTPLWKIFKTFFPSWSPMQNITKRYLCIQSLFSFSSTFSTAQFWGRELLGRMQTKTWRKVTSASKIISEGDPKENSIGEHKVTVKSKKINMCMSDTAQHIWPSHTDALIVTQKVVGYSLGRLSAETELDRWERKIKWEKAQRKDELAVRNIRRLKNTTRRHMATLTIMKSYISCYS